MKEVTIFTDGACSGNPGPGGWGVVLIHGDNKMEIFDGEPHTTNNRMELMAVINALRQLKESCLVNIYTDSVYVKDGITKWILKWKENGWKTANGQPTKNKDLWLELNNQASLHTINWHWVKGHRDNVLNEKADELARKGVAKVKNMNN